MRPVSPRRLLAWTFVAALAVNVWPLFRPLLIGDDLEILTRSWTWERTQATLWEPQNEHAMPLGRLSTRALVLLARRPSLLPLATGLQGILAQLTAMALLYLFIRRERDDFWPAVLATVLFGVTSLYHQAIFWFAASFSLLALDTLLLALLAAQAWRRTGRGIWLAACALATALAPGWFAVGVLAGPLCALYLLLRGMEERRLQNANCKMQIANLHFAICILQSLVPLLGTAVFLAVSLPRTADHIMHLEHYGSQSALAAFDLRVGAWYTGRSLVDNLALGQLGISGVRCPAVLVPVGLAALGAAVFWWWKRAANRQLIILGLAFILSSYLLVYSARAAWDYDECNFSTPTWSRYNLLPQLGLALVVAGGLAPGAARPLFSGRRWMLLLAALVLAHLPRVIVQHWYRDPGEQQAVLQLIERTDAKCRQQGIAAATAKAALGWLHIPEGSSKENGWDFLCGSDAPRPHTVEEARDLLESVSNR